MEDKYSCIGLLLLGRIDYGRYCDTESHCLIMSHGLLREIPWIAESMVTDLGIIVYISNMSSKVQIIEDVNPTSRSSNSPRV